MSQYLLAEDTATRIAARHQRSLDEGDNQRLRRVVRALLTVRGAKPLPDDVHAALDAVLESERRVHGETSAATLPRVDDTISGTRYSAANRSSSRTCAETAIGADYPRSLTVSAKPFHFSLAQPHDHTDRVGSGRLKAVQTAGRKKCERRVRILPLANVYASQ